MRALDEKIRRRRDVIAVIVSRLEYVVSKVSWAVNYKKTWC